ncbi:peptide chain release factor N(5)-glutamine methyltransferase [Lachnospiraceae bacterium ZAX-1]
MTLEGANHAARTVLREAGIEEFELDAWLLMQHICNIDKSYYYLHLKEDMDEEQEQAYEVLYKKRAERVPLQYITGVQEFMGLTMKVNSNVLIPRQDTESLVEEALKVIKPGMHVLDMCTGTGCIIISLLKYAKDIVGYGSDSSKQALLVAKENAKINQVEVNLIRSDVFLNIAGTFDLIVANPPYIPTNQIEALMPEVAHFEPVEALDGKKDGLYFYKKIIAECKDYLKPEGYLYFEIGNDQSNTVASMMEQVGFLDIQVRKDMSGLDRVVCGRRTNV